MATLKGNSSKKNNMEEVTKAIEAAEEDNVRQLEGDIEIGVPMMNPCLPDMLTRTVIFIRPLLIVK